MDQTTTPVAEIHLQPSRAQDYSAYVPVWLGKLEVNAFVDSGNTFTNIISPQMMAALGITASQLEPPGSNCRLDDTQPNSVFGLSYCMGWFTL